MFKSYFKIAWRNLLRNKINAFINIAGLALGISASMAIYLVVSFELSYKKGFPDTERIYRVVWGNSGAVPDPVASALRDEAGSLKTLVRFHNYDAKVAVPGNEGTGKLFDYPQWGRERSDIVIAEPQYFSIFKYQWLAGDAATALSAPFLVVLTESKAYKYFGRQPFEDMIGRTIVYNDSLTLTVSGIVKDPAKNTVFPFRDFISFMTVDHSFLKNEFRFNNWEEANIGAQTFVKLREGVTAQSFNSRLAAFARRHLSKNALKDGTLQLQPLSDMHFNSNYADLYSPRVHLPTLYALMLIAGFILLAAVINFINLSTAQSMVRAREIGIRKVLGGNRFGVMIQFLSETFMLTVFAAIVALLCLPPLLTLFRSMIPDGAGLRLFQPATLIFLLLITIVTTLLAGWYPARVLSGYLPVTNLKGDTGPKNHRQEYLRKGLVVFQFTISLVFMIATLVIGNQVRFMMNKDMGFTKDAIITVDKKNMASHSRHNILVEKIRQLPEVEMVSVSDGTPAAVEHFHLPLSNKGTHAECQPEWVDTNFVPLYQLKLKAGRNLQASDTMREMLINETAAKALGFASPELAVGQLVETIAIDVSTGSVRNVLCPVVGVLADFHLQSLHTAIKPTFFSTSKEFSWCINIKLSNISRQPGHLKATLEKIERIWTSVYPAEVFHYDFFDATVARFYENEQRTARLINTAMVIAIFISCMGLFGLAAFTARRRIKEIGIRKLLGASVANIVLMLNKEFILLIMIAIIAAAPFAWYLLNKWLENFAYTVNITWFTFLLAGTIAIVIALATVSHLAIRAATMNPAKSLRTE
ncbi:ABC transporter permease [Chitinophaga sp. GbtcB8]|uniref:ABC transporter permease n=1 Tax=Chitinophaga sp. GbtcB8 TaxID=2824753 RepID=UPI001C303EF7|nr:ABC transporter permease [Chitinophaga sp. GbtcB8]